MVTVTICSSYQQSTRYQHPPYVLLHESTVAMSSGEYGPDVVMLGRCLPYRVPVRVPKLGFRRLGTG